MFESGLSENQLIFKRVCGNGKVIEILLLYEYYIPEHPPLHSPFLHFKQKKTITKENYCTKYSNMMGLLQYNNQYSPISFRAQ